MRTTVEAETIPGWVGVNTHFGDVSQPFRDYAAATFIQQKAAESPARVLIFPEFIVPRWSEATEAFWRGLSIRCRARGQILVIGAGLPSRRPETIGKDDRPAFNFAASIDALESRRFDHRSAQSRASEGSKSGVGRKCAPHRGCEFRQALSKGAGSDRYVATVQRMSAFPFASMVPALSRSIINAPPC